METTAPATGAPRVLSTHPTRPPPSSARAGVRNAGDNDTDADATTTHPKRRQEFNALSS